MFLVRPPSLPGESLTSWRQRLGHANGFRLFPRAPGESWLSDSDLRATSNTIRWLSATHGAPIEQVDRLTLRGLDGCGVRFQGANSVPRWVLPLRHSRRDQAFGIPFCSVCLQEDKEPYFRLRWRIALSSVCTRHAAHLIDCCQRCGHPSWPSSSTLRALYVSSWIPIYVCPVCSFDLRDSRVDTIYSTSFPIATQLFEGTISLSDNCSTSSLDFAEAAWCVGQLFVRRRPANKIYDAVAELRPFLEAISAVGARSIEWLPLHLRHWLVVEVAKLFWNWPDSLLRFAKRVDLSAEHFNPDKSTLPGWFDDAIRLPLRRQVRGVTSIEVQHAVDRLVASNRAVTKQAVSKLLEVSSATVVDQMLGRRHQATDEEFNELVRALHACVTKIRTRRSSSETVVRDCLALLMSIALERDLEAIISISPAAATSVLRELLEGDAFGMLRNHDFAQLLGFLVTEYQRLRSGLSKKRRVTAECFFVCFRGGRVQSRGSQELLRAAMRSIDRRLTRNSKAFWPSRRIVSRDH